MTIEEIKKDTHYWQRLLRLAGYYKGNIDGVRGPLQRAGEAAWEQSAASAATRCGSFDERTERHLATLIPEAQATARVWLAKAQAFLSQKGLEVKIICGTRSYAEQDALYRKRPRVTNARGGYSMHNFGIAFDIGIFQNGKYLDDVSKTADVQYKAVYTACGAPDGMEWGGNWTRLKDYPHYQLSRWGSGCAKLRAVF